MSKRVKHKGITCYPFLNPPVVVCKCGEEIIAPRGEDKWKNHLRLNG